MSFLTITFAAIFYVATLLLVLGLALRIRLFWKTPAPLKIPTTPAPTTQGGVVLRMFREVVFFESLFKSTKWTWLFGWMFHLGLFLELFRHLRYFTQVEWLMDLVAFTSPLFKYMGFLMVFGLLGLLARRLLVDRVRYITAGSDVLMLLLLIGIGVTGALTTFVTHTDVISVKEFFRSLMFFNFSEMPNLPSDPLIVLHLLLVAILMMVFPYSKLLHVPGVFFSPTRNQVDNPREQRHIVDWARKLEQ